MEAQSVTTIICRNCQAELHVSTAVCGHCGVPTSQTGEQPDHKKERLMDRPWFVVVVVLHLGAFGIPVYWQTKYSVATRIGIILASILYTALAAVIIVWSIKQILSLL